MIERGESPEIKTDKGVRQIDSAESRLELAYAKAQGILERDGIKMSDVPKTREERALHSSRLKQRNREIKESLSNPDKMREYMHGKVLEALVHDSVSRLKVFGEKTSSIPGSEYDDKINGVDELKEFVRPDNTRDHLALAIDTTYGKGSGLIQKFVTMERKLSDGKLTRVDYFKSDHDPAGTKENVAHVVVGVDKNHLQDLMELWMTDQQEKIQSHPAFLTMLKEAQAELQIFALVNEKRLKQISPRASGGRELQERLKIAKQTHEKTAAILKQVVDVQESKLSRRDMLTQADYRNRDRVFNGIRQELSELMTGRLSPGRR